MLWRCLISDASFGILKQNMWFTFRITSYYCSISVRVNVAMVPTRDRSVLEWWVLGVVFLCSAGRSLPAPVGSGGSFCRPDSFNRPVKHEVLQRALRYTEAAVPRWRTGGSFSLVVACSTFSAQTGRIPQCCTTWGENSGEREEVEAEVGGGDARPIIWEEKEAKHCSPPSPQRRWRETAAECRERPGFDPS